jgi:shikimate kinase
MFIFVTGVAGSGKSELCAHLAGRGHRAYDADDGISRHVRVADGSEVAAPKRAEQTAAWVSEHEFRFDLARVGELAAKATAEEPVVLAGAAYGDEEVIAMADSSWFLHVGEPELRRRLATRPVTEYGHHAHELESILAWHAVAADRYERLGARRLDSARPVEQVADELLSSVLA